VTNFLKQTGYQIQGNFISLAALVFEKNVAKFQTSKPRPLWTGSLPPQIPGNSYNLT